MKKIENIVIQNFKSFYRSSILFGYTIFVSYEEIIRINFPY